MSVSSVRCSVPTEIFLALEARTVSRCYVLPGPVWKPVLLAWYRSAVLCCCRRSSLGCKSVGLQECWAGMASDTCGLWTRTGYSTREVAQEFGSFGSSAYSPRNQSRCWPLVFSELETVYRKIEILVRFSLVRFDSRFLVQNCPLLICPVAFEVAGEDRKVNGLRLVRNLCIFFCLI